MTSNIDLPNLGLGLGLRHPHFEYILEHRPEVDWFEVISENFMADFGWSRHVLVRLREHYPIVMHGVSMSIGSSDPLNWEYLKSLKDLAQAVEPEWVSDHLCWTGVNKLNTHDLLPMPLNEQSLIHVCNRVDQVQEYLGRPLILENPSTYLAFKDSTIDECEFLNAMTRRTGCGLLIDVNNVYVSARNHGFDADRYIDNLDHNSVVQTHIAGHTDLGDHCIDTHDQPVCDAVWKLYSTLQGLCGGVSTLLEWDANLPPFQELLLELKKADRVIQGFDIELTPSQVNQTMLSNPVDFMVGVR